MSYIIMRLPLCDKCGEPWLPRDKETRKSPEKCNRCGKCKQSGWDETGETTIAKQVPSLEKIILEAFSPEAIEEDAEPHKARKKMCAHGLLHCSICKT